MGVKRAFVILFLAAALVRALGSRKVYVWFDKMCECVVRFMFLCVLWVLWFNFTLSLTFSPFIMPGMWHHILHAVHSTATTPHPKCRGSQHEVLTYISPWTRYRGGFYISRALTWRNKGTVPVNMLVNREVLLSAASSWNSSSFIWKPGEGKIKDTAAYFELWMFFF